MVYCDIMIPYHISAAQAVFKKILTYYGYQREKFIYLFI